ncbi:MAG TPA: Gfo/Idh/MocA family oxidoreductase [Streptosporangiaceae bacterium]|nr:Gfo/Idh/MocA family oxidoreductase [Streptosporangiaceae bacterium]
MRLGLIGLGRIGAFHAETLSALPAVDTLVVADTLPGRAAQIARKLGAETADSSDALLRSGIDGLVIAAATDAHPALLREAVDAGVPVFCEKPVAASAAEAAQIACLVAGCADRVQIGYARRFDAAFAHARHALQAGQLGWVHTIRSTTLDPAPPPREYAAVTGGIFRDCSVHDYDAVRWATGREIVEVYATGSNLGEDWIADLGDVDTAATILTLDDGCLAVVSNTRYNAHGYDVRLELRGSLESIAAGLDNGLPLGSAEPGVTFPAGPPHRFFMDRFAAAFRAELAAFTEVVRGLRPSPCTVADAVESGRVAEAATLSLREHRPVRMDEVRQ